MNKLNLIIVTFFLVFQSCKSSVPTGTQVAKPVQVGILKGPVMISYGKFYFLQEWAVYKPSKWCFINFQKETIFYYSKIDTIENSKLYGILPVIAKLKVEDGKMYKIRVNHKFKFASTLNDLKIKAE
jgi:hypothetical protein